MGIISILFAAGLSYMILTRVKTILAQQAHLEDEDLEDYLEGRFDPESSAHKQAIAHLGLCEKCRQRLRLLEEGDDLV